MSFAPFAPFTAIPPTIPGDAILSSLNVSNFLSNIGTYINDTIDGIPLSVDPQGLVGITPVVSKTFPVGVTPAAIAITPDGSTAYVANNNNYGIAGSDSVSVLDLETGLPMTTITDASFNQPYSITITEDGSTVYVTNSNSTTVTIIDSITNTVTGTITGFSGPSGMAIKGTTGYVNNYGVGINSGLGTTVNIVNLMTNTITSTITVGLAPTAVTLTPNQSYLYVALYTTGGTGLGAVAVVSTVTNTLVATIPGFSGPFAIAMNPNGLKAYVTNFGSNNFAPYGTTVSVIDLLTNTVTNTITTGIQPAGAAVSPNGKYLYVTNYNTLYAGAGFTNLTPGQGTMSIIDTNTEMVVTPTVMVGNAPSSLAYSNGFLYVTNFISNTVSAIYVNQG